MSSSSGVASTFTGRACPACGWYETRRTAGERCDICGAEMEQHGPKPSVLYSDDPDFGPGGLFLNGELPDESAVIRGLALRTRGLLAELRPRERAAAGAALERLLEVLAQASHLIDVVDDRLGTCCDEARESRGIDHDHVRAWAEDDEDDEEDPT